MEAEKMNKKIILWIIVAVSIALGVYGYFVLPDTVTVQINISGNPSNTSPKLWAVICPAFVSIGGGLAYYFSKDAWKKYLILSIIGISISVITLAFNT